jgi:hypothetical protein
MAERVSMTNMVSMSGMKRLALGIPPGPLRDDILQQPDELGAEEYLVNARMWLRLARTG